MDRYSFAGKGSILIKAGTTALYGAKTFLVNEPIAYFTDVMIDISFSNIDKVARTGVSNLAADSKSEPSILRVGNIKISESLQSLLYKKQINNTKTKTEIKSLVSELGTMYLPIQDGDIITGDIFIYNSERIRATQYTLDPGGAIVGLPNDTYTVFYSIESNAAATYSLEVQNIPNLIAEIVIDGNLNGSTGKIVMHLSKLKLLSKPSLNFNDDSPFVNALEFAILSNSEGIEVNYYGG